MECGEAGAAQRWGDEAGAETDQGLPAPLCRLSVSGVDDRSADGGKNLLHEALSLLKSGL